MHRTRPGRLLPGFLLGGLLAAPAVPLPAQTMMPIPTHVTTNSGQESCGFWFQVPSGCPPFVITELYVSNHFLLWQLPLQSVEVRRYGSTPPASGYGALTFQATQVLFLYSIPCNIPVLPGEVISVMGVCDGSLAYGVVHESSLGRSQFTSSLFGNQVTLNGCARSGLVGQPGGPLQQRPYVGRVQVYVQQLANTASYQPFGSGCQSVSHLASARPVLGTTIQLSTSSLPPNVIFGATVHGLTEVNPGFDLGPFGFSGCYQYASMDIVTYWLPTAGASGSTPLSIPSATALAGLEVFTQGVAFAPGVNPASGLTSNGLKLHVGTY